MIARCGEGERERGREGERERGRERERGERERGRGGVRVEVGEREERVDIVRSPTNQFLFPFFSSFLFCTF